MPWPKGQPRPDEALNRPGVDGYVLRAPDLKTVIMDARFAGYITDRECEDLIAFYGLRGS